MPDQQHTRIKGYPHVSINAAWLQAPFTQGPTATTPAATINYRKPNQWDKKHISSRFPLGPPYLLSQ